MVLQNLGKNNCSFAFQQSCMVDSYFRTSSCHRQIFVIPLLLKLYLLMWLYTICLPIICLGIFLNSKKDYIWPG